MGRLTYNTSIFTNVNKWDSEYTYLGIFVSGKLNQRNGSGYPILDVIDLDWDGAYIKNLNTYLYTTEDLINVLDLYGKDHSYLNSPSVIKSSYLTYVLENVHGDIVYQLTYNNEYIEDVIVDNLFQRIDVLEQIRDVVLDDTRYIKLNPEEIFDEDGELLYPDQEYYIYFNRQYHKVENNEYLKQHPEETYYEFILADIIKLNKRIYTVEEVIGKEYYDNLTDEITYTGFYDRFHNIDLNIDDLSYLTTYSINLGSVAYDIAYTAYTEVENIKPIAYTAYYNSYENTKKIGHHTLYNVYEKITEYTPEIINYIHENNDTVYRYNDNTNSYIAVSYNSHYQGEYYLFYPEVPATGIEKEIEEINQNTSDNTYLLYKLSVESEDPSYLNLRISPSDKSTPNRHITASLKHAYINAYTGNIVKEGIITHSSLVNSFSYICSLQLLKSE